MLACTGGAVGLIAAVSAGTIMAAGLVWRMPPGVAHAAGLGSLAVAWAATSGLGLVAIRRGAIAQHREWMIRSYVVTFGFVTYRALVDVLRASAVGSGADRAALASWACWAIPLLVTEILLQGGKVLRTPRRALPQLPE